MLKHLKSNKIISCIMLIALILTIFGCSREGETTTTTVTIENPNAEEVLTLDPDADIFQFNGIIYTTNIDWVEEKVLTKDKKIGEIKTRNGADASFEDGMANKLPVGAKIFTTKEENEMFLIVEFAEESLKYYALVEG